MKPRLLVVDDDDSIRETLEMVLERRYVVTCVRNGREALDVLAHQQVDLVLLDLMMPVLDGAGFMAEAARLGLLCMPVLLMSAGTDLQAQCRQLGARDFMQKPISIEVLEGKLARALAPPSDTR